jgi:hypothetical protein
MSGTLCTPRGQGEAKPAVSETRSREGHGQPPEARLAAAGRRRFGEFIEVNSETVVLRARTFGVPAVAYEGTASGVLKRGTGQLPAPGWVAPDRCGRG